MHLAGKFIFLTNTPACAGMFVLFLCLISTISRRSRGIDPFSTQMGTIIADSSHFAAFNRSLLLRQVTVIATGFLPWCLLFSNHQKSLPRSFLPECYPRRSGWSAGLLPGSLPSVSFTDEAPSWHSCENLFSLLSPTLPDVTPKKQIAAVKSCCPQLIPGLTPKVYLKTAEWIPSDCETVPVCTFPISGKFPSSRNSLFTSRRRTQPSKEHLAVAGVRRLPSVLPSVGRLRLFG